MKCINCSNDAQGRSKYCGDSCKTVYNRNKQGATVTNVTPGTVTNSAVTRTVNNETVNNPAELPDGLPDKCRLNMQLVGGKVYNRQAVKYTPDQYDTRPEPLDPTDTPHKGGRGKYTRQDGTEYLFDSRGHSFDLTDGKVYATIDDVQTCYNGVGAEQEAAV